MTVSTQERQKSTKAKIYSHGGTEYEALGGAAGAALGTFLGSYVARLAKSMGAAAKSLFKQTLKYKKITENANLVHHFWGKVST